MAVLNELEPLKVFQYFEELTQIPRETFNTKAVSDYCVKFAQDRGLEYIQDEVNDVIIKKPATEGYEESEPIIIQGHLDMVCVKTPDSNHDFEKDPLELYIEDGYVKAKDTSLGADDGIAIAMALAILDSDDIPHPMIEALFTVDEESSMTGANHIDLSLLKGHKLLNIDSEEEGIITVGCAGAIYNTVSVGFERIEMEGRVVELKVSGLKGGHSGAEIHKQRGNANKIMGRLLNIIRNQNFFYLIEIDGGFKSNVITSECTAKILVSDSTVIESIESSVAKLQGELDFEFMGDEPELVLSVDASEENKKQMVINRETTDKIKDFLVVAPYGVETFNRKLEGLVETSCNIGVIRTQNDAISFQFLIRSSVDSKLKALNQRITSLTNFIGGINIINNQYPAWQFLPDSELQQIVSKTYQDLFVEKPEVSAVHAGLECGLFLGKRPDLDCVSFGPNLLDVHSVNEKLDIESTLRTWKFLKAILANMK